jgi:tripartite-type tricarboxylate transporter receptor subunit TctC
MKKHLIIGIFSALAVAASNIGHAQANDYPNRPIRLVIPFTPGGGTDTIGRLVGQYVAKSLNQSVVVENKPGAGGSIGTQDVARAPADGYTLLLATSSTHGINPWLYSKLPYDAIRDFTPVSMLATTDYALAVNVNAPLKTVADLISQAQTTRTVFASSGNGTTSHLAGALFAKLSNTQLEHIPYKSSGPALNDLLGNQVSFMFDNTSVILPHAKAGKLRILATSGAQRSAVTKDVPTLMESGLANYEIIGWWALLAPAGTPPAIIEKLNMEVVKALEAPEVKNRLLAIGNEPYATTAAQAKQYIESELKKFKPVVELAGAKLD